MQSIFYVFLSTTMSTHHATEEAISERPLLSKFACIESNDVTRIGFPSRIRATVLMMLFMVDMATDLIVIYYLNHFSYGKWFSVGLAITIISLVFQFLYCEWGCNSMLHIFLRFQYLSISNVNTYMQVMHYPHHYRFNTKYLSKENLQSHQKSPLHPNPGDCSYSDNVSKITHSNMNQLLSKKLECKVDDDGVLINNGIELSNCQERAKLLCSIGLKSMFYLCHFGIFEQYVRNMYYFHHGITSAFLDLCNLHCYFHSFFMFLLQLAFLFHHMLFNDDLQRKVASSNTSYNALLALVWISVLTSFLNIVYTSVTHETYRYLPNYCDDKMESKRGASSKSNRKNGNNNNSNNKNKNNKKKSANKNNNENGISWQLFNGWTYMFGSDMLLRVVPYVLWSVYVSKIVNGHDESLHWLWRQSSVFLIGFVFGVMSTCMDLCCHVYLWFYHQYLPRSPWNYTMKTYVWSQIVHPLQVIFDMEPAFAWLLRNVLFYWSALGLANVSILAYVWNRPVLAGVHTDGFAWKWLLRLQCILRYILGFFLVLTVVLHHTSRSSLHTFAVAWLVIHVFLAIATVYYLFPFSDSFIFRCVFTYLFFFFLLKK
ncbi:hypothetical protein RFI_27650 [Reticulomyxa filosa]|uniref:Uncharacterized protein n=1 Tax=Reticulomyxa filosa TaxID=46433 RepID=X6M724_RETFI|nr:hypothetical protein RFI_27650 [Reticulomyxa filosa]|eukprot:ETO09729.1 hypothetical protein RFI_27650 [Reticulomyxa filosa]